MNLLNHITNSVMRRNSKRTIVAAIGLILAVAAMKGNDHFIVLENVANRKGC